MRRRMFCGFIQYDRRTPSRSVLRSTYRGIHEIVDTLILKFLLIDVLIVSVGEINEME